MRLIGLKSGEIASRMLIQGRAISVDWKLGQVSILLSPGSTDYPMQKAYILLLKL